MADYILNVTSQTSINSSKKKKFLAVVLCFSYNVLQIVDLADGIMVARGDLGE